MFVISPNGRWTYYIAKKNIQLIMDHGFLLTQTLNGRKNISFNRDKTMGTPVVTRSTDASSQNKNGHRWKAGLDAGGQGRRWPGAPVGRPASMPVGRGTGGLGRPWRGLNADVEGRRWEGRRGR